MSELRVLVLNHFAAPRSGAGGTRHVELFGRLRAWNATILTSSRGLLDGARVRSAGMIRAVPVTPYRGNGIDRILNWASYSAGALVLGLFHRRTTVVYGSSPHLGAALTGLVIARLKRVPFVMEVRDLWPRILVESGVLDEAGRLHGALKRLELFLYRSADRIVVLAEGSRAMIAADGIDDSKVVFIPNGADPADFEPSAPRAVLRRRYRFERFTVVYAGAHGPANGLDLVIDAADELRRAGVDVSLVLIGDGLSKAGLIESARRRDLTNVEFRDPVPKSEIPDVLAAADVGLHCLADVELFKSGVSPNKLYDYMAAGLPVVTNTGGEVAAMVRRAGAGEAVAPDEIAAGVCKLAAAGDEERRALGAAGRAFMEAERSRRAMAARLEDLLDALV